VTDIYVEAAKNLGRVLGGAIGGGSLTKVWMEKRERDRKNEEKWENQKQSHWSPLLEAARELKERFDHLSCLLRKCTYHGKKRVEDQRGPRRGPRGQTD